MTEMALQEQNPSKQTVGSIQSEVLEQGADWDASSIKRAAAGRPVVGGTSVVHTLVKQMCSTKSGSLSRGVALEVSYNLTQQDVEKQTNAHCS